MKKLFSTMAVAAALFAGYSAYNGRNSNELTDVALANIEALANSPDGAWTQAACHSAGGNWNMATVLVDSGFEEVTCEVTGKIKIFEFEMSGSYKKGNDYKIPWARYKCEQSNGNCCIKQGMYSGENKLA